MTFTQIIKDIFTKEKKTAIDNSSQGKKGKFKTFLSRLPGGFMLPISVMAIAGLFMGVGTAIEINTEAKTLGSFLNSIGSPIFGAMPTLFLVAIVISFTDEAGVGVFAGIVSFLTFNAMQMPFIDAQGDGITGTVTFLGIQTSLDIQIKMYSLIGTNLGIESINTSIFGGIIIGLIVAWIYNRFHLIKLPSMLSFFGGKRFVAIISIIVMIPMAFLFLLIWPWIGLAFAYFGEYSATVSGLDSFLFGLLDRMTLPFGLSWPVTAPLQYTSAGGDILTQFNNWQGTIIKINGEDLLAQFNNDSLAALKSQLLAIEGLTQAQKDLIAASSGITTDDNFITATITNIIADIAANGGDRSIISELSAVPGALNYEPETSLNSVFIKKIIASGTYAGDTFGWLAVNGSGIESVTYQINGKTYTEAVFPFIDHQIGMNLGRFYSGGAVAVQQFGLPAAAMAMIMAAPKSKRKEAFSICFPAAITSLVAGVTEPIEYTFLFLAPWLFFGFHAFMAAFSFLFANLLNVHFATTFAGGLVDTIIYGIIPMAKGTNFYWAYVIGIAYAPIYYFVFYYAIKHFNLSTPGRGGTTSLFTKANLKQKNQKDGLTIQEAKLITAMGGWDNITSYTTCITRLRYDIKNKSLVKENDLKAAGAIAVIWNAQNLQTVMGVGVEQINSNIKKHIGEDLKPILARETQKNNDKTIKAKKTNKKETKNG